MTGTRPRDEGGDSAAGGRRPAGGRAAPSLLYMVKRLELAVRSNLDDIVRPAGVTALQYTALTVLERHDGLSAAQLARDSFVTAQSMADMVRALERRGLVRRERNPASRRELLIHLTDAGRALLADLAGPVRRLEERMIDELTARQEEQFRRALSSAWRALS
ncbi:MarR family winged helix-turn-helix transcriptional regulator [Actinomadura sediminis]|uniref:MarR family winged helix-turn-helix transcriptional regulator n=1 Tax=Actinomadura sediminis TaxID=1038904 RepID=A0ABW3EZF6_9ACTN